MLYPRSFHFNYGVRFAEATYFCFCNYSPPWDHSAPGPSFRDDIIKWKHFPCYWPFVPGIHLWSVKYPHKGQRRGTLMFSLICARINGWVNNREAGDLRIHRPHYDDTVIYDNGLSLLQWNVVPNSCSQLGYSTGVLQVVQLTIFTVLCVTN